jgi:hypothetical protein
VQGPSLTNALAFTIEAIKIKISGRKDSFRSISFFLVFFGGKNEKNENERFSDD